LQAGFDHSRPARDPAIGGDKTDQKIDVDENRITALKAEAKAIKAELAALAAEAFGARPAYLALAA
jgi:hypothetical protein